MSTGKIICIIICLVGAVIILINTILKIIFRHTPIYKTNIFAVYKNYGSMGYGITNYRYRCVMTKEAKKKLGDLGVLSVGDSIEEALDNAKYQIQGRLEMLKRNR